MTADMAFECLLITHDPLVFSTMSRILQNFSISTDVCLSSSKAVQLLQKSATNLIVIDWGGGFPRLLPRTLEVGELAENNRCCNTIFHAPITSRTQLCASF